jgi:hypothetical protein
MLSAIDIHIEKKSLKIPKGKSESVNGRRTDNLKKSADQREAFFSALVTIYIKCLNPHVRLCP